MITTSKHPSYSYLRRISGLCIMLSAAIVLTLSIQEAEAQRPGNTKTIKSKEITVRQLEQLDSIDKVIRKDEIIFRAEGESRLIKDTPVFNKNESKKIVIRDYNGKANDGNTTEVIISGSESEKKPIYLLDGKEIEADIMKAIKPESIHSVNVLKGESATNKYGEKAKDGAIEITMKKPGRL